MAANTTERLTFDLKMRTNEEFTNTVLETGHHSIDYPTIRMLVSVSVGNVSPRGDAQVTMSIEHVSLLQDLTDTKLLAALNKELPRIVGRKISWRVSDLGEYIDFDMNEHAKSTAAKGVAKGLESFAVTFPAEPVGVGAAWEIVTTQATPSGRWITTATYHVARLDVERVALTIDTTSHAEGQTLVSEPHWSVTLVSGGASGHAEFELGTHQAIPTGTSNNATESVFRLVKHSLRIDERTDVTMLFTATAGWPETDTVHTGNDTP